MNPTIPEALERFRKWKYDTYFYKGGLNGDEIFLDLFVLADAFEELTADEFWKARREKTKQDEQRRLEREGVQEEPLTHAPKPARTDESLHPPKEGFLHGLSEASHQQFLAFQKRYEEPKEPKVPRTPIKLEFCTVSRDEELKEYKSLEEMLGAEFYPGNYNPTKDQAKQLLKAACLSAIRWAQLHPEKVPE